MYSYVLNCQAPTNGVLESGKGRLRGQSISFDRVTSHQQAGGPGRPLQAGRVVTIGVTAGDGEHLNERLHRGKVRETTNTVLWYRHSGKSVLV